MSGGKIDARGLALLAGTVTDDEYMRRAQIHRPALTQIRAEAQQLRAGGLTARDIATALRIREAQVIEWIAEAPR